MFALMLGEHAPAFFIAHPLIDIALWLVAGLIGAPLFDFACRQERFLMALNDERNRYDTDATWHINPFTIAGWLGMALFGPGVLAGAIYIGLIALAVSALCSKRALLKPVYTLRIRFEVIDSSKSAPDSWGSL